MGSENEPPERSSSTGDDTRGRRKARTRVADDTNASPSDAHHDEKAGREAPPSRTEEPRGDEDPGGITSAVPDLLRRAMALGLSGFFSTEGALRKALGDTVPQDWVDFASEQSDRTRMEVTRRLAEEFGRVLDKMDMVDVFERILEGRSIEVTARIRLGERDTDAAPDTGTSSIRVDVAAEGKKEP